MNRPGMNPKGRKADPRMPFEADMQKMLSGYLYPQLHRDMRRLPARSAKKWKRNHE